MRNETLIKAYSSMNPTEQLDFVLTKRKERETYIANSKKPAAKKKRKVKDKVMDLLKGMSDEEKLQFIKENT